MNKDKIIALRDSLLALTLAELAVLDVEASNLHALAVRCEALIVKANAKPLKEYNGNPDVFLAEFDQADQYFTAIEMRFMQSGQKISAIKELRSRTGFGLADAKNVIKCGLERFYKVPRIRTGYGY